MHIYTIEKWGFIFLIGIFAIIYIDQYHQHQEKIIKIKQCGVVK